MLAYTREGARWTGRPLDPPAPTLAKREGSAVWAIAQIAADAKKPRSSTLRGDIVAGAARRAARVRTGHALSIRAIRGVCAVGVRALGVAACAAPRSLAGV